MARQFMKLYCDILRRKDLTPAAKLVYTVLSDGIRREPGGQLALGLRRLAKDTGLTVPTVSRAIQRLLECDDIRVGFAPPRSGFRRTYWIPIESAQQAEAEQGAQDSEHPEEGQCATSGTGGVQDSERKRERNGAQARKKRNTYQNRADNKDQRKTKAPTFSWKEVQPRIKDTCLDTPEFAELWAAFVAHREQMKAPLTAAAVTRHLKAMLRHGLKLSIEGLGCAIDGRWKWFQPEWLPSRKAPGSGAPADRPGRVRCTNGRYDNIGTIIGDK